MGRKLLIIGMVLICIAACRPTTPSQYIQPDEMEDLLVDFHLSKAMAANAGGSHEEQTYRKALYWHAVLEKHHVTEEQFDSSLVYYYIRADRFVGMYKRVLDRLQNQAVLLGATESEIGKYASLNATGDTANIWQQSPALVMIPMPPYHRYDFEISTDSLFRAGDTFLMQFVSDFVYQSGSKSGLLYLTVDYPDTVVVRQTHFSYSGMNQVQVPKLTDQSPKAVRGYFYLGGADDASTTLRMLFINNIQLIRFHGKKDEQPKPNEKDSIPSVDAAQLAGTEDDGSGTSVGKSDSLPSIKRGASSNRVVERIDSLKSRH